MSLADRLRELAERLPTGGSLTITRDGLLGLLDAVAGRAGRKPGEITPKMFRHTYASARLQTMDHGAPMSIFTVSRELGHRGVLQAQLTALRVGAGKD